MEEIYFIELSDRKTFPKITYYNCEINDILHDSDHFIDATFYTSIDIAEELKVYIEGVFDYDVKIIKYKLVN